jgi:DNA primase
MAFPSRFLDELRARVRLADVVGKRVRLQRKGRDYMGLCPFHKEKTPSFTVNEAKGFYHCFGCGAHGSLFDFVMETEGLGFREAVERLAGEAGLEMPVETPEERAREQRQKTLVDVCEAAAQFFEKSLRMPEGKAALEYLRRRGLDDAAIVRFRLGYSLDSRTALKSALERAGITEDQMVETGLLIRPEEGDRAPYDRFRGRVMFPILDRRNRVIAFGGRVMGDGEPKYLNSPETPLFHKGFVLYGLAQAAAQIHKTESVIVSEGYMDVIALHLAGFETAVAPLGTALTEDHLQTLWKLAREPVLCFDGDSAGQRAAGRAVERALPLLKPGMSLKIATLPAGEDPDSLIRTSGPEAMKRVLDAAIPLSEALWQTEVGNRVLTTPEERAWLEERLKRQAAKITDDSVRRHFRDAFQERLRDAFRARRAGQTRSAPFRPASIPLAAAVSAPAGGAGLDRVRLWEAMLLATLLNHPDIMDIVGERLGSMAFSAPDLDILRQEVLKTLTGGPGLDRAGLHNHLQDSGFSEALSAALAPRIVDHAVFARPEAPMQMVLAGWEETFESLGRAALEVERAEAARRLAEDLAGSDDARLSESFERLSALKQQKQDLFEDRPENYDLRSIRGIVGK